MFSLLCCCEVGGLMAAFACCHFWMILAFLQSIWKTKQKNDEKSKTPPLIERRYKYITHTHQARKIPSPKSHSRGRAIMSVSRGRDPESLERENDRSLETMGDRVSMLKNITMDIHKEADSHHRILDGMRDDMSGFQGVLTQTVQHFSKVLETKNGRYFCYLFGFFIGMWFLSKIIFA